jgi:hypothetical protein
MLLHPTTHKDTHMKLDQMLESRYLKQSDFTQPALLTIKGVSRVNLAAEDEIPEYKWTLSFVEKDKPMVLNSTNLKRTFKAAGDDTDLWPGKRIVVYVDDEVEYAGKVVGGLRIRAAKANPAPAANPTIAKVEAMRKASQPESENPAAGVDDDFDSIPF